MFFRIVRVALFVLSAVFVTHASALQADTPNINNIPLSAKIVPRKGDMLNLDNKYVRLVVTLPQQPKELVLTPRQLAYKEQLTQWLKQTLFGETNNSALISATVRLQRNGVSLGVLPAQAIYQQTEDPNGVLSAEFTPGALTPFVLGETDPIEVVISARYRRDVKSHIAATLVSALKLAAIQTNSASTFLTKFTRPSFQDAASKADKAIEEVFGSTSLVSPSVFIDPRKDERIELTVSGKPNEPIAAIVVDVRDAIISPNGSIKGFPTASDDITKFKVPDDPSQDIAAMAWSAFPSKLPTSMPVTTDQILTFCERFSQTLAEHGMNKYDRAAVLFAYLINSGWNLDLKFRDTSVPSDRCESRVDFLDKETNLVGLQTRDWFENAKFADLSDERVKRLFAIRVLNRIDSLLNSDDNFRYQNWPATSTPSIKIGTNVPILLGDGSTLPAGGLQEVDVLSLPEMFNRSAIWRDNAQPSANCYSGFVNLGTYSKFRSRPNCIRVKLTDGTASAAEVEFVINSPMSFDTLRDLARSLSLTEMRVIVRPTPPVQTAAAPSAL